MAIHRRRLSHVTDSYRYERKFLLQGLHLEQVRAVIQTHPAHFRIAYPPRQVNNVYFDTADLQAYWNHVNGTSPRSKLRLRWYGQEKGLINSAELELKAKDGLCGTKPRCPVGKLRFSGRLDPAELREAMRLDGMNSAMAGYFFRSSPSLFNRYLRRYYVSADGRFRLTVDTDMLFRVVNGRFYGHRRRHSPSDLLVVELKYDVADDADAFRICDALPFRRTKLSKYVYGIGCLGDFAE